MQLLLDTTTHDIVFDNTNRVTASFTDSIVQRLKIRLLTFLGEWFLDGEEGVPYFQSVLGIKGDKSRVDVIFKEAILKDPDVVNISSFTSTLDISTRQYSCTFTCLTKLGVTTAPLTLGA
jgi:hypothetical protein